MFIARKTELEQILACVKLRRHVLIEGPVGVGKTALAKEAAKITSLPLIRIDGDGRYTEQKLTGWFDPPRVIKEGYQESSFFAGPLVEAMKTGSLLFINELNRMPEGVQNILLSAMDEGVLILPRLKAVQAKDGFAVIATQNPKEFIATNHLSEALLDRFELVQLDYLDLDSELEVIEKTMKKPNAQWARLSTNLIRLTREDERFRRGASTRAGIAFAELCEATQDPIQAALLSLSTKVELEVDQDKSLKEVILELLSSLEKNKTNKKKV